MPVVNLPTAAERLDELVALMPESMRIDTAGEAALRSLLEPIAKMDTYLAHRREKLLTMTEAEGLPDELVPYLAANVGWDAGFSASSAVQLETLRRITPAAVAIWKEKGTSNGIRTILTASSGSRSVLLSWFELRWVTGTARAITLIPGPSTPGGLYSNPQWVTDVWYMDPTGSEVNVSELTRVLDVVRAAGERLNLRAALILDDQLQGEAFWTRTGSGASHAYAKGANGWQLSVSGTDGFFADLGGASNGFSSYRANLRIVLEGVDPAASIWVLMETEGDRDESYRVALDGDADEIRIYRTDAGSETLLATASTSTPIVSGYGYDWSLDVSPGGASTTIKVYRGGLLELSHVDSHANRGLGGGVAWAGENANAIVRLEHCLTFEPNPTTTRIGPNP